MCTMTWFLQDHGYQLFFNRDEKLSRSQAETPTLQTDGGLQFISPTDADAGGTWIAVNQFGVTVCLLNHYEFEQIATYKDWTSRGEIVRKFATIGSIGDAIAFFNDIELVNYRAFRMFIIQRNGTNGLFIWDGHKAKVLRNVTSPKSSSSVNAKQVKASRNQYFVDLNLLDSTEVDDYLGFHFSHFPNKSEYSVCMHRDDANTVSLSHISVDAQLASFAYTDGPPCEAKFEPSIEMDLIDSVDSDSVAAIAAVR